MKKAIYTLAVSALSTFAVQALAADIQGFNYIFFRGTNDRNSSITLWGAPVTILKAKAPAKGESELTADVDTINQIVVSYELDYKTPDIKRFNTTGY